MPNKKTISLGKISLENSGINKEDIIKKFIKNTGSAIVHKNVEQIPAQDEEKSSPSYSSPYDIPDEELLRRVEVTTTQKEEDVRYQLTNKIQKLKPTKDIHNIVIPTKLDIKVKKVEKKKQVETEEDNFHIFGKTSEPNVNGGGIVINVADEEEITQKEDHRDKSIIEKHLRHYKYLEFDEEKEIDSLKAGENLRALLAQKRNEEEDEEIEVVSTFIAEEKTRKKKKPNSFGGKKKNNQNQVQSKQIKQVEIPDIISIQELASRLSLKVNLVVEKAKYIGEFVEEDSIIDGDIAELIVEEFDQKVLRVKEKTPEDVLNRKAANTNLQTANPVVTVMGHVDHGKTSLLDALRKTDVALGEAGGITQAIGAYQVTLPSGKKITFIDTPGHEAFTAMRARGANATDIIVLVIAADDSINTQTIEAIHHAKAAKCPIIVAVNKMDLPSANLQKVKEDLLSHDLVPEDFGGDIAVLPVSALKKTGLKELEERILLQADVMSLKANYAGHAGGVVLESRLDNKRGVIVTVLIKHGVLKNGDVILAGTTFGRVRKMIDDKLQIVEEALPAMPVEVYGFSEVPQAGERFFVLESEKSAREVVSHRMQRKQEEEMDTRSNDDPFAALLKKDKKEVNVIIRADTQGSVDAIKFSLAKISHEEIKLHIVQCLVGNVTEADILLSKTNNATIFAFNVTVGSNEEMLARKHGIAIREHSIIYKMIDEIKALLSKSLAPVIVETKVGVAAVRQVFDVSKSGKIAGLFVQDGVVKRGSLAKVLRNGEIIGQGNVKTLKHFHDDVKTIQQGKECGMQMEKFEAFQIGDIIEIYDITYEENKIS
jgi:translation initiation factor IF-2